jgi:hypothetical protein
MSDVLPTIKESQGKHGKMKWVNNQSQVLSHQNES